MTENIWKIKTCKKIWWIKNLWYL